MVGQLSPGLYAITDCTNLPFRQVQAKTAAILAAGVAALQYRNKTGSRSSRLDQARVLASLCRRHHTPFIVNDEPELAADCGADGVHLGRDDASCMDARSRLGPDALIGISCYDDLERALEAQAQGADYVAFGAFFPTVTKTAITHPEPELIARASGRLRIPIVAIGGITTSNARVLLEAGAHNLAVISALYHAADPAVVARKFHDAFRLHSDRQGEGSE